MSQNDDEFKDVKMGLPSEGTAQKSSVKFLTLFIVVGVVAAIIVFGLAETVMDMMDDNEFMIPQVLITGMLTLLIGSLQAWIFKAKIRSRLISFVAFSFLGGVLGGLVGGIFMDLGFRGSSILIGAINGLLAGMISSVAQNRLMGNTKYGTRWFVFNSISWTIIFAIAWTIAWQPNSPNIRMNIALAGAFLLIASGISLVMFLRGTPQIEFS